MIKELAIVGLGGGLGSICRYLITAAAQRLFPGPFPLGTTAVNLLGCVLIGYAAACCSQNPVLAGPGRLFFIAGFLGGFTTLSAFGLESLRLLENGQHLSYIIFVFLHVFCSLALVALGARFAS